MKEYKWTQVAATLSVPASDPLVAMMLKSDSSHYLNKLKAELESNMYASAQPDVDQCLDP